MVCLTDLFATCAELVGAALPADCAQDSFSFLGAALGSPPSEPVRQTMVNHSNFGEFAYRSGGWKLVYRLAGQNLEASRGRPTVPELYDLNRDIAESENLASASPQRLAGLTADLAQLIDGGASRPGAQGENDCEVRYDRTQQFRWIEK